MAHNHTDVAGLRDIWRRLHNTLGGEPGQFEYKGDAYDTPPLWIRLLMLGACLFGYALMLVYFLQSASLGGVILLTGALGLAAFLLMTVPRAGQTALVAVLFWGVLGGFALFWPI
jgi:hypothetical protein